MHLVSISASQALEIPPALVVLPSKEPGSLAAACLSYLAWPFKESGVYLGSRVKSTVAGRQSQELEIAIESHVASLVRKEFACWCSAPYLSYG